MTTPQRMRPSYPRDRTAAVFRPILIVFVLAILVLEFPGLSERMSAPWSGLETRNLSVQRVLLEGPNAGGGIRPGDEIVSIGGTRIRNRAHYQHLVSAHRSLAAQDAELRREGVIVHAPIRYAPVPRQLVLERLALLVVALSFIAVGMWVFLRRSDTLGTLFAINTSILAFFLTDRPSTANPVLQLGGELFADGVILLFPAALLHFFLRFPDRGPRESGRAVPWLYLPGLLIAGTSAFVAARRFGFHAAGAGAEMVVLWASTVYFAAYVVASLVVFARAYRAAPRAQKQKQRVVIAATVAGLAPFLAATLYAGIRPQATMHATVAAALCLGFVPFGFAYAILKHGAIELNTVVRKSLFYALLTGVLVAGYYAVVHTVGVFLTRELGLSEFLWMPIAALVLAIAFAPIRERVQTVVDRVFYRTEFVYKQEVIDFGRRVARTLTRDEVLDAFLDRCEALLHPSFVAVYLRNEERDLVLARARGDAPSPPPALAPDTFLGRYLTRYRTPLMVEFLDRSWERPNLDAASRRILSIPGLAVCVPIAAPDRLLGVAMLGQKRSGQAYRRAEGELLETFSEQLALVIENADLIRASIEKERLKSEVLLARDIQQALLPPVTPSFRDIEISGQMVSSTEVGGDYFDYFPLDDERVVIAIGDVSGKGIPAAMLMASLQAVFKNRATRGALTPSELNQELNDYLVEHAKPGQFATFFCGVVDVSRSTLTFSSAGQCPALHVTGGYIDRLGNGGMVLGASRLHQYAEGTVAFRPGDLLLLYTDGVTEQMSPSGEPFGEERLMAFVRANRNLSPENLQNALREAVLAYGGGRQDDDLTSVIALRKSA